MTLKNSILLTIKQSPGIDYADLLGKISPRYKNIASANSALNRVLKDMVSFGLAKRENTKFFLTDKGNASISVEMKDKLIIRLNEEMKKQFPNPETVAQYLIILSQRSSVSPDLLNSAKQNATFTINDINVFRKKIFEKRRYLKKMSLLLKQQSEKLESLDFNDSAEFIFDNSFISKAIVFCNDQKLTVETKDEELLFKVPEHWKKQNIITVEKESIGLLLQLILSNPSVKATLYFPGIKVLIYGRKVLCFGSHNSIIAFLNTKTPDGAKVMTPENNSISLVK